MKKELIRVVQLAQSGDEDAFQRLYQLFYKQAYATALLYCKNDADAKDAVQDTFFSIHKALPNLRSPEIFDYWMTRIIRTKCIKIFAKSKEIYMDDESLRAIPNKFELRKDHNPYENNEENQEKALIHHFVKRLSERQRICVEMFYFDQLSLLEISDSLHVSLGTIKSRLFEARKALKREISSYEREQGIKVRFRADTLLPITFFAFFQKGFIMNKVNHVKKTVQTNSITANSLLVVNMAATLVTVGSLGVGGVYLQQEMTKQTNTVPQTEEKVTMPSFQALKAQSKKEFPSITFKNQEFATPKAMYYAILSWYQRSGSSTSEEITAIKQMYQTIKAENGQYWELLKSHEWSNELEQS